MSSKNKLEGERKWERKIGDDRELNIEQDNQRGA